jgi:acyl-CoA oxidase
MEKKLSELIENDNFELREKMKNVFKDPLYTPRYNLALPEERELAYRRLKNFCEQDLFSVFDFEGDPRKIFAAHEVAGLVDGSMATKMTVQFNLFGGTLLKFGNRERFQSVLEKINNFEEVGCFGLTELGYGNNAVEMETTAIWDESTDEFIIDSPSVLSQKYWITNGYCHAHWCIVFAQLIIKGESYGVHGFLVEVRDKNLNLKQGVTIHDMGMKIGVNGVDNAKISFNQVRIPRAHLLDAFSQVDEKGLFSSEIKGKRARFLKMADQLLSGRICIASMTLNATKMGMLTSYRYSKSRKGVGPQGKSDAPIISYQFQQNTFVPLLAETLALCFGHNHVKNLYAENKKNVVKECCVIKAMVTWHSENSVSVLRERSGGQGYLACNRFGEGIGGAHAGITAEGDNGVLMQKVAKELLDGYKVSELAKNKLKDLLPGKLQKFLSGGELGLLKLREESLKAELALRMQRVKSKGREAIYNKWVNESADLVQDLALAYGQRFVLERFEWATKQCSLPVLIKCKELYAKLKIKESSSWFLSEGILSGRDYRKLCARINQLNKEIAPDIELVINSFNIPEFLVHAPMAKDWVAFNSYDHQGEVYNRPEKKSDELRSSSISH